MSLLGCPRGGIMHLRCASFSMRKGVGQRQLEYWHRKLCLCRMQATAKSQNQVCRYVFVRASV